MQNVSLLAACKYIVTNNSNTRNICEMIVRGCTEVLSDQLMCTDKDDSTYMPCPIMLERTASVEEWITALDKTLRYTKYPVISASLVKDDKYVTLTLACNSHGEFGGKLVKKNRLAKNPNK